MRNARAGRGFGAIVFNGNGNGNGNDNDNDNDNGQMFHVKHLFAVQFGTNSRCISISEGWVAVVGGGCLLSKMDGFRPEWHSEEGSEVLPATRGMTEGSADSSTEWNSLDRSG